MSEPPLKTLCKCRLDKISIHYKWWALYWLRVTHPRASIFGLATAESRRLVDRLQAQQEEATLNVQAVEEVKLADRSAPGMWLEHVRDEFPGVADPTALPSQAALFQGKGVCAQTVPLLISRSRDSRV